MMALVWIGLAVLFCFGFVLLVGPPYLPTLQPQVTAALDLLDLKPGETMLELGCGDGVVLLAEAQRGWQVVGIELNPLLVLVCRLRTWRYRKQVTVTWGNYWNLALWPADASGIFGFVLPRLMAKLDATILDWQKQRQSPSAKTAKKTGQIKLASFAFKVPGRKVAADRDGVFLYTYQ